MTHPHFGGPLALSLLAITLSQRCSASDEQLLRRVHDAEVKVARHQDDNPAPDFDGWMRLMNLEKELFLLCQGKHEYMATSVFKSARVRNKFDLSSFVADDTVHVTEDLYSSIGCSPGESFRV